MHLTSEFQNRSQGFQISNHSYKTASPLLCLHTDFWPFLKMEAGIHFRMNKYFNCISNRDVL